MTELSGNCVGMRVISSRTWDDFWWESHRIEGRVVAQTVDDLKVKFHWRKKARWVPRRTCKLVDTKAVFWCTD